MTTGAAAPAAPKAPSRMTLANIGSTRKKSPKRIFLIGVEGIGKSTFGANAPDPVFIAAESGLESIDAKAFPGVETWEDARHAVRVLTDETHAYKTLVLDTVDWLEPLLWKHICQRDSQESIESYGYGKGYVAAVDEWRAFLADLERLRRVRGMHVILLAHATIRPFKNPEGEDFDRYQSKLNDKAAGLLKEWCDVVMFANHETFAKKDAKTKRVRGVSTGARLLYTTRTAAYDAKNRDNLPEQLPLSWADFWAAIEAGGQKSADLIAEIERKAVELGGEVEKKARAAVAKAGQDAALLAQVNTWLNAKLNEKAA